MIKIKIKIFPLARRHPRLSRNNTVKRLDHCRLLKSRKDADRRRRLCRFLDQVIAA